MNLTFSLAFLIISPLTTEPFTPGQTRTFRKPHLQRNVMLRSYSKKGDTWKTTGSRDQVLSMGKNDVIKNRIDSVLRPRCYSLFMLEKFAHFIDDSIALLAGIMSNKDTYRMVLPNKYSTQEKDRIVVLGTGWGAASFLRQVDTKRFEVTVISPRNYFLFTPMLAGASVGTVEYRSITMPIRQVNANVDYLEASATSIDTKGNTVSCTSVGCDGDSCDITDFEIEYDHLIVSVGAQTNTFGIPGVLEYCCFLKNVDDARQIRQAIINLFERANLPNLTNEERRNILTFAIIGAGPTGVEFAGELRDFVEEDGLNYYPGLLDYVRIKIFDHGTSILKPFHSKLQKAAITQLTRESDVLSKRERSGLLPEHLRLIELHLDHGVKEVKEDTILLDNGQEVKYGLCLWAAGNGPLPLTLELIDDLGREQLERQIVGRGRIAVDPWLRAIGGGGKILALGDCACVCKSTIHQLPATAQVASQQGEHLARLLSDSNMTVMYNEGVLLPPLRNKERQTLATTVAAIAMKNSDYAAPFQFHDMGILAYVGGETALAQLHLCPDMKTCNLDLWGKIGFGVWQSIYLSKQASWKNRVLVFFDWIKSKTFGRDITQL